MGTPEEFWAEVGGLMVTDVFICSPWVGVLLVLATSQADKLRGPDKYRCSVLPLRTSTQSCPAPARRREERLQPEQACLPASSLLF
ncbi:hypothetical protein OIU77_019969 [Salix suchowensis]|uniref:Uncharacterized protein n=1 Tax=Salix suchowensis TaxID=1278906 RepID=A0ABQ9CLN1_9ROSI|nr:hypothetical protein OIU77_019969 [Salix suchowensis]